MASDILKKEAEFYELNKELEMKAQAIIKQVNSILKPIEENQIKTSSPSKENPKRPSNFVKHIKDVLEVEDVDDETILPEVGKNMGMENIIRFLKAKVKKLQEEILTMQTEQKRKSDALRNVQNENKNIGNERNKYLEQVNANKDQLTKLEDQVNVLSGRLLVKDTENQGLRKEIEGLKKELKSISSNSTQNDLRLNRALEEVEKLKSTVRQMKQDDKEFRENSQKQTTEMNVTIKRLEKYKTDLEIAFKKQLLLIDNLKRQKVQLEAMKMLKITEEEFIKILDWNFHDQKNG